MQFSLFAYHLTLHHPLVAFLGRTLQTGLNGLKSEVGQIIDIAISTFSFIHSPLCELLQFLLVLLALGLYLVLQAADLDFVVGDDSLQTLDLLLGARALLCYGPARNKLHFYVETGKLIFSSIFKPYLKVHLTLLSLDWIGLFDWISLCEFFLDIGSLLVLDLF